ncbi:MAG: tetratricopeptide repeat protein [Chloroflexota bacterium]
MIRLRSLIGRLPTLVLLFGMVIFALALVFQYWLNRPIVATIEPMAAPYASLALTGLAITALTLVIVFTVAGIALARQTRRHGSEYAHAYRLMDELQFSEAIPLLENSIATGKETVEVLTLLARAYISSAHYSQAHSLLERAIDLYGDQADPYATLGFLFLLEGSDEQAVTAFQAAVERQPLPAYWADLGFALVFAHRDSEARTALEKASEHPLPTADALRVYHHLMVLYTAAGRATQAASAAAKMVSAREGLADWEDQITLLKGTGYGQRLAREIQNISDALKEAESALLTV